LWPLHCSSEIKIFFCWKDSSGSGIIIVWWILFRFYSLQYNYAVQVSDYAIRKQMNIPDVEKWLSSILGYEP
jgi:hypothetical protein